MQLTASTSLQSVRERLGVGDAETLRESEKRRRYLQTYARLLTSTRPSVRFSEELRTATTDDSADTPEITVTTRPFAQPATDFRRRVFDLAVQEALVVHEVGHLRYTDSDDFRALLERVDPARRRLFSRVWNTLEDGAIERQLRHRYAVAPELEVLNANLFQTEAVGHTPSEGSVRRLSLFHAVICGLADMAIYDSGRFRRLRADDGVLQMASVRDRRVLQEFVPTMRETVETVLTEPDPAARNRQIWSFWEAVVETLDTATVSGAGASELARLLDDDGTVRTRQDESMASGQTTDAAILHEEGAGAPLPGKPDDTTSRFDTETRLARDLGRETVTDELDRQLESVLGDETDSAPTADDETDGRNTAETETSGREQSPTRETDPDTSTAAALLNAQSHPGAGAFVGHSREQGADSEEASGSASGLGPGAGTAEAALEQSGGDERVDADGSIAAALRRHYTGELSAETSELDRAKTRLDELKSYVKALETVEIDDATLQVVTESAGREESTARWSTIQRDAKRLARRFRNRLQEQRRSVERSQQRRGSLDRSRLISASRGNPDVFTQTEDGPEREYTCLVVLDRSASMSGDAVVAAERGALTTAAALEMVGVNVTLFDLYDSTVRLVKTVAETAQETRDRLLTRQTGGGTPLASALALARSRFGGAENPFVLVVTDGRPDDETSYLAQLDASGMPVLGVYLKEAAGPEGRAVETDRSYFHQLAVVENWDAINQRLRGLAGRVLF